MGVFDIFSDQPAQDAAQAQIAGIQQGQQQGSTLLNKGLTAAQGSYSAGLAPFQTNFNQAQPGVTSYGNATGANGPAGYSKALMDFAASPGQAYQLQQGDENVLRNDARTGTLNSGGTQVDLQNVGQGVANQNWQQYISNLLPFLGQSNTAAQGIGAVSTAQAGTQAGNYGDQAQLAYGAATGEGNANANADLAKYAASGNIWNAGMNLAKLGTQSVGQGGTVAGNVASSAGKFASGLAAFL